MSNQEEPMQAPLLYEQTDFVDDDQTLVEWRRANPLGPVDRIAVGLIIGSILLVILFAFTLAALFASVAP